MEIIKNVTVLIWLHDVARGGGNAEVAWPFESIKYIFEIHLYKDDINQDSYSPCGRIIYIYSLNRNI